MGKFTATLKKLLCREVKNERYELTGSGIVFPRADILCEGVYWDSVNGEFLGYNKNLVVGEGLVNILNIALGATAKHSALYIALGSSATTPAAGWTATNYNANAAEILSVTEGYSGTSRPTWAPNAATAGGSPTGANASVDNVGAEASFTIVTGSTVTVRNAAIVNAQSRLSAIGSSDKLISCTQYGTARELQDGDVYKVGYRLTVTG